MAGIDRSVRILMKIYQQKIEYFEGMAKLYKEKLALLQEETHAHQLETSEASQQQERIDRRPKVKSLGLAMVRKKRKLD